MFVCPDPYILKNPSGCTVLYSTTRISFPKLCKSALSLGMNAGRILFLILCNIVCLFTATGPGPAVKEQLDWLRKLGILKSEVAGRRYLLSSRRVTYQARLLPSPHHLICLSNFMNPTFTAAIVKWLSSRVKQAQKSS